MPKSSEAQIRASRKYTEKNYKKVSTYFRNDEIIAVNDYCEKFGCSKNGLIIQAVTEKIERDTGKKFNEFLNESQDKTDNGFSDGSQVNQLKCGSEENP